MPGVGAAGATGAVGAGTTVGAGLAAGVPGGDGGVGIALSEATDAAVNKAGAAISAAATKSLTCFIINLHGGWVLLRLAGPEALYLRVTAPSLASDGAVHLPRLLCRGRFHLVCPWKKPARRVL
jgi:hypothetical protein